jgi:hypothetical protein
MANFCESLLTLDDPQDLEILKEHCVSTTFQPEYQWLHLQATEEKRNSHNKETF